MALRYSAVDTGAGILVLGVLEAAGAVAEVDWVAGVVVEEGAVEEAAGVEEVELLEDFDLSLKTLSIFFIGVHG